MLAAGVVTSGNGTTTPTDPGTKTPFSLPERDARTMALRPTLPAVAKVVVAQDGTGDYTSIADAANDLENARLIGMAQHGKTGTGPDTRVDIAVAPGTYTGYVPGVHGPLGVYAIDPTPGATVLQWGMENAGGFYWEGVDITNVDNDGNFDPKYAFHIHADAANPVIFTCMSGRNDAPQAGGYPTTFGMDGADGATIVFHRTNLETGVYTNLHGPGPMNVIFSDVNAPGVTLQYAALDDADTTAVWIVGTNTKAGTNVTGAATTTHVVTADNPAIPWPTA